MSRETDVQIHEQDKKSRQQSGRDVAASDETRLAHAGERSASVVSNEGGTSDRAIGSSHQGGPTPSAGSSGTPDPATSPLAQMHRLIERAGEEPFPDDIIRTLAEPIDAGLIDIKSNGSIFVSHPHYRDRLDRAFGVGGWALVPLAAPKRDGERVMWWGFLKARGRYIDSAMGGCSFVPSNMEMNYDDAIEGAKSDCLARCCKSLPMFRECWDKEYADAWKAQHAYEVQHAKNPNKRVWKKKGASMREFDVRPGRASVGEYNKPSRLEDENQRHIDAIPGNKPLLVQDKHDYQENEPGYNEWEEQ